MQNPPTRSQVSRLEAILKKSTNVQTMLRRAPELNLPHWYLGAGAIVQTVWNELHGLDLSSNIKDFDLVYFDSDISEEAQASYIKRGKNLFKDLPIEVDITNEARVHVWYEEAFGKAIEPYQSTEAAIRTWPTTATSIGVRYEGDNLIVYAPFGLDDLFSMIVRPNKVLVTKSVYEQKVQRWTKHWPKLTVIDWDTGSKSKAGRLL